MHTFRTYPDGKAGYRYTVGFFEATIGWQAMKDVAYAELAMAWVSYLNGGPHPSQVGWMGEE